MSFCEIKILFSSFLGGDPEGPMTYGTTQDKFFVSFIFYFCPLFQAPDRLSEDPNRAGRLSQAPDKLSWT